MAENSKIEWTDHTFNPWIGCTKVSAACDHCYAEALAKRYGWVTWGPGEKRKRTSEANWHKPIVWNRKAEQEGVRRRVFCASLADVFDAEVSDQWQLDLLALMDNTRNLDWLLLTKRPQVAKKFRDRFYWPTNFWLGTTVENQEMADLRIPTLINTSAPVRFLSCEPLLGPITIRPEWAMKLDWIICGGESGSGARMMPEDSARYLRDQCRTMGIYFFMKQMTAKAPIPADLLVREFPNSDAEQRAR